MFDGVFYIFGFIGMVVTFIVGAVAADHGLWDITGVCWFVSLINLWVVISSRRK